VKRVAYLWVKLANIVRATSCDCLPTCCYLHMQAVLDSVGATKLPVSNLNSGLPAASAM